MLKNKGKNKKETGLGQYFKVGNLCSCCQKLHYIIVHSMKIKKIIW